jgi:hypothetical protein
MKAKVANAAEWRKDHEAFWAEVAERVRAGAGDPDWELRESEPVERYQFRLGWTTGAALP